MVGAVPFPKIVSDQPRFCPLQPPESRVSSRSRRVRQASYHRSISSRRLIDIMEIARSACPNERVWQELCCVERRFVESPRLYVGLENATMSRSHDSLHTMVLSLQISATPPAPICMLCERGVVLKSAPRSGSMGLFRCWKFGCACEHAVQFFSRYD